LVLLVVQCRFFKTKPKFQIKPGKTKPDAKQSQNCKTQNKAKTQKRPTQIKKATGGFVTPLMASENP